MSNKKLPYHTIHINDELTGTRYLIDTGAYCSVYPASHHERNIIDTDPPPTCLTAANGSTIKSHGTKDIQICINGRSYPWTFRLAQVTKPLLGADFLAHHHLLVDIAGQRLIVADSYSTTPLCRGPATHINVLLYFPTMCNMSYHRIVVCRCFLHSSLAVSLLTEASADISHVNCRPQTY